MDGDRDPEDTPPPAPSTAEAIAERAAELFSEKGFAATSIREIAEAAGVTKPTLYYYFGSKEGLVRHILLTAIRSFAAAVESAEAASTLRRTLHAIAVGQLSFADSHPATVNLMCRLHHQPPGEAPLEDLRGLQEEGLTRLAHVFEEAMASGEIAPRDARLVGLSFLGALIIHVAHRQRTDPASRPPAEVVARQIVDLFLHGARGAPEVTP